MFCSLYQLSGSYGSYSERMALYGLFCTTTSVRYAPLVGWVLLKNPRFFFFALLLPGPLVHRTLLNSVPATVNCSTLHVLVFVVFLELNIHTISFIEIIRNSNVWRFHGYLFLPPCSRCRVQRKSCVGEHNICRDNSSGPS